MTADLSAVSDRHNSLIAIVVKMLGLETLKEMSTNRKRPLVILVAVISLALAGCGGGGAGSSSVTPPPPPTGNTSTPHPDGMWSTLPGTMPINPIHAALLHTGRFSWLPALATVLHSKLVVLKGRNISRERRSLIFYQEQNDDGYHLGHVL